MTGLLVTRALIVKTIKWRVIKDLMRCFYQNLTFDATITLIFTVISKEELIFTSKLFDIH